jgi:hypothetical protein
MKITWRTRNSIIHLNSADFLIKKYLRKRDEYQASRKYPAEFEFEFEKYNDPPQDRDILGPVPNHTKKVTNDWNGCLHFWWLTLIQAAREEKLPADE